MSYCRFGEGSDLYLYSDIGGYICCCSCILTPRTAKTIFTSGWEEGESILFKGSRPPCENCNGDGCPKCCMHHDSRFYSYQAAIEHVKEHIEAGHDVPDYVIERLEADCRMDKYLSSGKARRHKAMRSYWKRWHNKKVKRHHNSHDLISFYQNNQHLKKRARSFKRYRKMIEDMRKRRENDE